MAYRAGTVAFLMLDNASGSLTNLSAYTDTASISQGRAMIDVTSFGTSAETFMSGIAQGQTIPVGGGYDVTLYSHITALLAAQDAGTASHSFLFGPGGSVASQAKLSGEFLVANFQIQPELKGRVNWSAELQVTGAITNSTF